MSKRVLALLMFAVITLSLAGCSTIASANVSGASQRPVSFVRDDIVIYCGMERQTVKNLVGKPDDTITDNGTEFEIYDGLAVHYIDDTVAVIKLETDSLWKTTEGIGIGSHVDDLAVYPFDTSNQKSNVYSLTFQIINNELTSITWNEFSGTEQPENSFYLTINVNESKTVYDVVIRDSRFMESIFS